MRTHEGYRCFGTLIWNPQPEDEAYMAPPHYKCQQSLPVPHLSSEEIVLPSSYVKIKFKNPRIPKIMSVLAFAADK